jgi:hypothetical protein
MAETVRVFISSPGDVAVERALARKVLNRLRKKERYKGRILIEEVSWDDPDNPFVFDAHCSFQGGIDLALPKPSQCDVVVVILWTRLGSPLSDEFRRPDGRICRSGTEWEYLDALSNPGTTVWLFHRTEPVSYLGDDPDFDAKRAQELAVKAFLAKMNDATGANRHGNNGYASPSIFERRFEDTLADWLDRRLLSVPVVTTTATQADNKRVEESKESAKESDKPIWEGNPYRGLQSFGPEHAPIFFGRGLETDALAKRMRDGARVLVVVGASGSGKSSLVAAGLLPRLQAGAAPGSQHWVTARFTPAEHGSNPFRALALAVSPLKPAAGAGADDIASRLATEPGWIETLAGELLTGKPADAELLLFVDQFEELFTARVDKEHRAPFVALMEAIAKAHRVRLMLTLRADYYPHCTEYPGLAALLREGSFPLAAPDDRALTEMVEGPARTAGLEVEPGLVGAIAKEAGDGPGRLALVEYALENLYDLRRGNTLSLAAYRDELKGIAGLIERQGDQAAQGASETARHEVFDALSEVDAKGGAVRKRAFRDDLSEPAKALVERLQDARLLTADRDPETGRAWIEVAHEAVLRDWPLFSEWLREYGAFKLWRQGLEEARQRWAGSGQKTDDLLSGGALKEAELKQQERPNELTPAQIDFILKSRRRAIGQGLKAAAWALLLTSLVGAYLIWTSANGLTHTVVWRMALLRLHLAGPPVPDMVPINCSADKPCWFKMGKADTAREAVIEHPYAIGRYEVTFDEYEVFSLSVGAEGGCQDGHQLGDRLIQDAGFGRGAQPVINVSWQDAQCYADWLSKKTGKRYRLPSVAEWNYAARAKTSTHYFWGPNPEDADRYAWFSENAGGRTHPVGEKQPNDWGLHDTEGNVSEWISDCVDAEACISGLREYRGGSWFGEPVDLRSAERLTYTPNSRFSHLGFRLAQDLE